MKSFNKLVSVVIPVYNQEKYLNISIPSVQNQTYSNLEIIAVNDGSTDSSANILAKYAENDNRIKIVEKTNGGLVDATITGIKNASGNYVAFLDPDDYWGEDFIYNLVQGMDETCDFSAAGFYYDNCGELQPYCLSETRSLNEADIARLVNNYLPDESGFGIFNLLFISRWNKVYSMRCVKKAVETFENYKGITLGEDSIFTYLVLKNSKHGIVSQAANSYYYNIGNQNSMMKNRGAEKHIEKAKYAFSVFGEMLRANRDSDDAAYILYYYLVETLYERTAKQGYEIFSNMYRTLCHDEVYRKALKIMSHHSGRLKQKCKVMLRLYVKSPKLYMFCEKNVMEWLRNAKYFAEDCKFAVKSLLKNGLVKTRYGCKFRANRRNAFKDMEDYLPELESRITPLLKDYIGVETNLDECPIERNIFVFWWDGFDNAPIIVKKCLETVKKYHPNSKVIEITKDTFLDYTDIHPTILKDFNDGKISVQTFSDILRFNLLKNNGGTWIDATIFFADKYDLSERLTDKAFESVEFATSKNFLQYKGESCSWSGYFITSRKNSIFVQAVNHVFEQYYLTYGTYSIYFFIDAVMMICKLNRIDGGALHKIHYNPHDMFVMSKMLDQPYDERYLKQFRGIPQKLNWFYKKKENRNDTVFDKVVNAILEEDK